MTRLNMNLDDLKRAVLEKKLEEQLKTRGNQQQPSLIKQADRNQPLPLSFAQQRLWFLSQLDPAASLAYHLPVILRLRGQLDRHALVTSLDHLIARHESLRTRFVLVEGQPCQHIEPADIGFALSCHDLRQSDPALHTDRITELIDTEAQTPFDFTQGPLIRGQLLQLTDEEHVLLLTLHHIITDGWSIGILVQELGAFYRAALEGHKAPLPSLPIQYADYAVWQHDQLQDKQLQGSRLQGTPLTEQRDFWCDQLKGAPALLTLPADRPRPAVQTYIGGKVSFHLDATLLASLKGLGQRHNSTLFMTVLTAWGIVLARLSGQDDIVIGTPVANRPHHELEGLIGFFVNTLALRVTLNNDISVAELLAQVRERALAAYANQDLPFEQVVEALQPERSLSYSPIFQVMLALNNTPGQELTLPGLQLTPIEQERRGAHFDLTLSLNETEIGLIGDLEYAADLFDFTTVERMVGYLTNVLTAMAVDETQSVTTLPMLPASERHQLLVDFNATQTDFPQNRLIHQLVEAQALKSPNATAVVCEGQTLSYDELNRHANRLAHHLIALGVRPDDPVAICVERSLELVVGLLAILKAGGAYVPLDPNYPAERLAYMLEDAAPVALLTQTEWAGKLGNFVPTVLLDTVLFADLTTDSVHNPDAQALGLTSRHRAYIIYTSGSTGLPKGVIVEHRSVLRLIINNGFADIGPDDCIAHCANISFDAAVWEVWSGLVHGARILLIPEKALLQPTLFGQYLSSEGVSVLFLTTALFNQYANLIAPALSSLRYVFFGGEQTDTRPAIRLRAEHPPKHLLHMYGPTETTTFATTYEIPLIAEEERKIPIGQPISNTQIYVLDSHGQPVPLGVTGEIYVAGAGVARGYLNRPELTAERFLTDPFSSDPDARMYKTGDLGRWLPDGNLEYIGRNDFQIKLRGFRIELGEIEAQLTQCHGVQKAVVLAREEAFYEQAGHEQTGGQKRLVAYVQPQTGVELVPAELRQQLAQHLAEYMLPSAFIILEAFPLTPNGKTDRDALPAPDASAFIVRNYESPTGETEIALAQIWQNLLGLEHVGRYDHFFELGGHSLMIVSLIEELRNIGWQLDVRNVFSTPILADMALTIQRDADTFVVPPNRIPEGCTAIVPDMLPLIALPQPQIDAIIETIPGGASNVQDIYPLAPLQEGILFHYLMQAQGDTYLLQSLLAFDNRERLDVFLAALQQVIDRHDILRTAVYWQGLAQPVQAVWRQAPLDIQVFTPATENDIPAQLRTHTDPLRHRINLNRAPLFAADIAYDSVQDEWLLALRFHHLVSDHMTLELIFAEIALILQGHTDTLPTALPYRNFIAQTLSVPATEHEAYFRAQLADIDAPTAPFGVLSIPNNQALSNDITDDDESITEAHLPLDPILADSIRAQARRLKVSPSVLFHVAWAQVLAQTSGRDDVVFGSVLLGRLQGGAGANQILGMFINTLPIRISLADRNVQNVVRDTYHNLMALLEHEQAPLTLAQSCSGVEQPMPLFSTLLNYRHSQISEENAVNATWSGMRVIATKERTNYPIILSVDDLGVGFHLSTQTVASIDPSRVIHYLLTAIRGLIEALVHDPQLSILNIPILPETERQQLLVDFNATQRDFPQDALIHPLFEAQVLQRPHATAVVCEGQTLSYDELNQRANRLAHHLIALGVRPDDRVAICLERSLEMVVGLLAILKAGGAYLPLDPTYPAERLNYMLEDATPVALLTQTQWRDKLASTLPTILFDELNSQASFPVNNPDVQATGLTSRHLAYVIYTSGSTGQPKGVMVEHRNVLRLIINNGFADIGPDDCIAHCANVSFDAATWEIWSGLVHGARILLIPEKKLLQPANFGQCLSSEGVSALFLTTALFNQYATLIAPALSGLRYVLFGGEQTDTRAALRLRAEHPPQHLLHVYGPTETTTFATAYEIPFYEIPFIAEQYGEGERKIPIGRPISNTQTYILDKQGQPVPVGVAGEIYIAGAGVARGYLNRPELTAERFLTDPFSSDPDARMYKTGDLGCWRSDGNIEYLGRNDFQIKLRGFRIELGEIEARLRQCHGVQEAIVLIREDEQNQKRLVAYLCSQTGVELVPAELRRQLSSHLADYMLPSAFVTLDAFPLTPNGKFDRQALPLPDLSAIVTHEYEAPNEEEEIILAQIWQDLLGLERVGRHDNFFELGGHSLMIVQLATRIQDEFLVDIPISSLFLSPKLVEQAGIIFTAQMDAIGKNDIESLRNTLDLMSAEELMSVLGGDSNK
ncbi:hypothetical protein AB204_11230 [Xenorhabdus khoisanae]|uniref:Carrier domain-containing protein n=2 Tax=Xenorhabdus khoisanae TaxID=880157 RepID=A0A0J5FT00_9GAMM|nr:hypothetical protein AB204_11230 [Xenorhabdus khoisanae]